MTSLIKAPLKRPNDLSANKAPIFGEWAQAEVPPETRRVRHLDAVLGEVLPSPPKTAPPARAKASPDQPPRKPTREYKSTFVSGHITGVEGPREGKELAQAMNMELEYSSNKLERSRLFHSTGDLSSSRVLPEVRTPPSQRLGPLPRAERHMTGSQTHRPHSGSVVNSSGIPLNTSPVRRPPSPPSGAEGVVGEDGARRSLTWATEQPTWRSYGYGMNLAGIQARAAGLAEPVDASVYSWMTERPASPDGACGSKGRMVKRLWEGHTRVIASSIARMRLEMDEMEKRSKQAEPLRRELAEQKEKFEDLELARLSLEGELDHSKEELEKKVAEVAVFMQEKSRLLDIADKYEKSKIDLAKSLVQLDNKTSEVAKLRMDVQTMKLKAAEQTEVQVSLEKELTKALDSAETSEIAFYELLAARTAADAYKVGPVPTGPDMEEEEPQDTGAMGEEELRKTIRALELKISRLQRQLRSAPSQGGGGGADGGGGGGGGGGTVGGRAALQRQMTVMHGGGAEHDLSDLPPSAAIRNRRSLTKDGSKRFEFTYQEGLGAWAKDADFDGSASDDAWMALVHDLETRFKDGGARSMLRRIKALYDEAKDNRLKLDNMAPVTINIQVGGPAAAGKGGGKDGKGGEGGEEGEDGEFEKKGKKQRAAKLFKGGTGMTRAALLAAKMNRHREDSRAVRLSRYNFDVDGRDGDGSFMIPASWRETLCPGVPPGQALASMEANWREKHDGGRPMALFKMMSMVVSIYQAKLSADQTADNEAHMRQPLDMFTVDFFMSFFGLKTMAIDRLGHFVFSMRHYYLEHTEPLEQMHVIFMMQCGIISPLPFRCTGIMLETMDVISHGISGYKGPKHFWTMLGSGKGLGVTAQDVGSVLIQLVGESEAAAVLDAFRKDLMEKPESLPNWKKKTVPEGGCTLSRFLRFMVEYNLLQNEKLAGTIEEALKDACAGQEDGGVGGMMHTSFVDAVGHLGTVNANAETLMYVFRQAVAVSRTDDRYIHLADSGTAPPQLLAAMLQEFWGFPPGPQAVKGLTIRGQRKTG